MQDKEHKVAISLLSLGKQAREEIGKLTGLDFSSLVGITMDGKSWSVLVEVVEKHTVPSSLDLLGLYELHFDESGKFLDFKRKGMRMRTSTEVTYESGV